MTDHIENLLDGLESPELEDGGFWGDKPPDTVFDAGFRMEAFQKRLARGWFIKDKRSSARLRFGPLLMKRKVQLGLANRIMAALKKGGPVRILVLKSRKLGVSTLTDVLLAELAAQIPGWYSMVIAHTKDTAVELFQSVRMPVEQMADEGIMPEIRVNTADTIRFGTRSIDKRKSGERGQEGSTIRSFSAGGSYVGSGHTPNALHLSECAKYDAVGGIEAQEAFILSALGGVPKIGPSIVVAETTANGQQGWFYNTWRQAVTSAADGNGDTWIPIFIPWFKDPDCVAAVPPGYRWEAWDAEDKKREERLVQKHGVTREQLYFRRRLLNTDFNNNVDYWDQEYPDSWETAFVATGSGMFPRASMERMRSTAKDPLYTAETFCSRESVEIRTVPGGTVRVYEDPEVGAEYILGADVADGVTFGTDASGRRLLDASTFSIWKRELNAMTQVVECVSYADNFEFGRAVAAWGKLYNNALVNVERNRAHAVLAGIRQSDYPTDRLFRPPMNASVDASLAGQFFFHKSAANSKFLVDTLASWAVEKLVVRSRSLVHEFGTLRRDNNGQVDTNGKDVTIACAMAVVADAMEPMDIPAVSGVAAPKERTPWNVDDPDEHEKQEDGKAAAPWDSEDGFYGGGHWTQ